MILHLSKNAGPVWTPTFYMGKFGSASPKRHKVWSNDEGLLEAIFQRGGYMSREQQNACSTKLVRKYTDKKGVRRCVCLKDELRNSQRLGFTSAISPGSRIFPFPYKCGHAKIWEGDVEVEYILNILNCIIFVEMFGKEWVNHHLGTTLGPLVSSWQHKLLLVAQSPGFSW